MALLYHGGFHALQLQRVAHCMWESGNITSALRIQVHDLICKTLFARHTFMELVPSVTKQRLQLGLLGREDALGSSYQEQEDVRA